MHRGRERTDYIPFPLNPETRSDVIPVRLHFSSTLPQARQPISHRRVCVNKGMVPITHFKVSHGDLISLKENEARIRGSEIRRSFYIEISVEKIIGKFLDHPGPITLKGGGEASRTSDRPGNITNSRRRERFEIDSRRFTNQSCAIYQ
ncbi:Ribosomal protein S4, mitochondrial, partial [Cucurbita argyrosperma subsp. sororia]